MWLYDEDDYRRDVEEAERITQDLFPDDPPPMIVPSAEGSLEGRPQDADPVELADELALLAGEIAGEVESEEPRFLAQREPPMARG